MGEPPLGIIMGEPPLGIMPMCAPCIMGTIMGEPPLGIMPMCAPGIEFMIAPARRCPVPRCAGVDFSSARKTKKRRS